ncbi:MAG: YgjV family protein [Alphaproteobacteria bacterium]|nr:YgjV family protein [Alphaproteobacteria bacterium]
MIWLGYFFTVLNYLCYCLSRFMKHKKMMLLLDLLAKVFTALGLYFLDSLSGAYIFMAVFFMLIVANIKERLNKRWLLGYVFFQSLYLTILFYTYGGISSVLVVTTVSVTLFCIWWLPPQQMRFIGGLNCFTYLAYQISIKNWAGLLEILVILSNLFSFLKYRKNIEKNST